MVFRYLPLLSYIPLLNIFQLLQKVGIVVCLLAIAFIPFDAQAETVKLENSQKTTKQETKKSTVAEWKNPRLVYTIDILTDAEKGEKDLYGNHLTLGRPYPLAFNPDGKVLASGGANTIRLWDFQNGKEISEPLFSAQGLRPLGISLIYFSPDGKLVNVFSFGREISASNRREFSFVEPIEEVWNHSTRTRISSGLPSDQTKERLFSTRLFSTLDTSLSGKLPKEIQQMIESQHGGEIYSVVLSANEKTLVTSGKDAKIRIWRND
jgi:WD40 repeat protein